MQPATLPSKCLTAPPHLTLPTFKILIKIFQTTSGVRSKLLQLDILPVKESYYPLDEMRGSDILFFQCRVKNSPHLARGSQVGPQEQHVHSCFGISSHPTGWLPAAGGHCCWRGAGAGASLHTAQVALHRLSETRLLSFRSSAHDLHSFSPKLLSTEPIH